MIIRCAICEEREFCVEIEIHQPIQKQPVLICFKCFSQIAETEKFNTFIKNYKKP